MINISIIVLCRDNAEELAETLRSILRQTKIDIIEVIIGDGSKDQQCHEVSARLLDGKRGITWRYIPDSTGGGIYQAMNSCIAYLSQPLVMFMNSGDYYKKDNSIYNLCKQYEYANTVRPTVAVFGAVEVVSGDGLISWSVPSISVKNVRRWLIFFEPNHQGMLFSSKWVIDNPFRLDSPIGADATFKADAIKGGGEECFFRETVACFGLGGVSSKPATLAVLRTKLKEPSRSVGAKLMELLKYMLFNASPVRYERIMKWKSLAISKLF